jgi:hypothetical protein
MPYAGEVFFLNQFLWFTKYVSMEKRTVDVVKRRVEIAVHSIAA